MTDADRIEAAREIWDLIKAGRTPMAALYEFERLAIERAFPLTVEQGERRDTEPVPPP